ncbi:MAG: imidazoleglycerol-phosphate dehydratase HisB [Verrucomicrobiota bacterium]|jgi:imidazoleglycerol-phosphate dehydratase|nr:imidazoleglycerol-phosphate dehydratase [Opitutae bacterium]MBO27091.1 imidazoleglycerol-phosphate dehydratase [Opitutales bacterium]MEC7627602.1 imidazoleglycerol-phosphate dehydratase HisB [Verrucomicrobiota bacterium]MEC8656513.1 imidazoleglycerol-phosphate dehydratase HisB [Verrucomicrobiota bacterium]MEC8778334.1 imidazoleglycerol-phosphate dehydratase HisB [Verrucomicrobiota bacterium]|tara:strand:- start:142 stop:744 length:603 start_codon:yes stop_codon:yes gene_type:complete
MANTRIAEVIRETKETQIKVSLSLDGTGEGEISTGIPFMDHMLDLFSRHGFFDLSIVANGDIEIDYHHLVEDMGISLGQAFREALGDKAGIRRYGFFALPMDETLVTVALDLSNRAYLVWNVGSSITMVRDFNVQLFKEFFQAFANEVACNVHIRLEHGEEPHHVAEAIFKGFAKSMDIATQHEVRLGGKIPSTKGTLSA